MHLGGGAICLFDQWSSDVTARVHIHSEMWGKWCAWLYFDVCHVCCHRMNSDTVDYEDSCLIVRYMASMRPFAQSFDIYLTQVRDYYISVHIFFTKRKASGNNRRLCVCRSWESWVKVPLQWERKRWNVFLKSLRWIPAFWPGWGRFPKSEALPCLDCIDIQ